MVVGAVIVGKMVVEVTPVVGRCGRCFNGCCGCDVGGKAPWGGWAGGALRRNLASGQISFFGQSSKFQ